MDALIPGHAHRSSSDRLLNNFLDSQKNVSNSLLNLLSQSHSSTSSLLAYVTSSPGVVHPVRRSVRHAGFEGPLSAALAESAGSQLGSHIGDGGSPGWAAYLSSLERFRQDLKQIHQLEQELSRVKRDREILVTRLIKTTKSRPTRSDLSAIANSYSQTGREGSIMSSRASTLSIGSAGSHASKEGKRAGKLAEAQAELLGCEEHLRSLEVRIEHERNKVMLRGLEERFNAMEVVGRMWIQQAKRGLEDLDKAAELPQEAYEVGSNDGSIAPSMSASQTGDRPRTKKKRASNPYPKVIRHMKGPGSVADSIAEEDEGSSDDQGDLVMHENRPGGGSRVIQRSSSKAGTATGNKPSPLGVPSVNARSRPLSATGFVQHHADSSDSDLGRGGRRAMSDIGAMAYRPPKNRQPLRRTFSHDDPRASPAPQRAPSITSSTHQPKKKRGFFASLSRFFKGGNRRQGSVSGRESPPYGAGNRKGGWNTRTNQNIKSATNTGGRNRGNESSSDDEGGNFVSVANTNRYGTSWSAADVGRPQGQRPGSRASLQRNNSMPVASGLIPAKPGGALRNNQSQSTLKGGSIGGRKTPTTGGVTRSKSTTSAGVKSASSAGAAGPNGTIKKKKALASGSITRAAIDSQQAAEGRNIMNLVDMDTPSSAPYVATAPRSQVNPQMELARAPGSSLAPPADKPSLSRSSSARKGVPTDSDPSGNRSTTPLPPSRSLQPPLKSALRPTTPSPSQELAPPLDNMFSISAPGPVDIKREESHPAFPAAVHRTPSTSGQPGAAAVAARPVANKRQSYQSNTTAGESVYHSAEEGGEGDEEDGAGPDSSSEEETDEGHYQVVENEAVKRADIQVGPPEVVKIPMTDEEDEEDDEEGSVYSHDTATAENAGEIRRSKSVRITAPDSPNTSTAAVDRPAPRPAAVPAPASARAHRATSPDPERPTDQNWDTRIGRMREDTTDEESDPDDGYRKAKKGLMKNSGAWEAVESDPKVKKGRAGGSVKSRGSQRSGR